MPGTVTGQEAVMFPKPVMRQDQAMAPSPTMRQSRSTARRMAMVPEPVMVMKLISRPGQFMIAEMIMEPGRDTIPEMVMAQDRYTNGEETMERDQAMAAHTKTGTDTSPTHLMEAMKIMAWAQAMLMFQRAVTAAGSICRPIMRPEIPTIRDQSTETETATARKGTMGITAVMLRNHGRNHGRNPRKSGLGKDRRAMAPESMGMSMLMESIPKALML